MKKLTIILTATLLLGIQANAQKFYFRGGLGYALSHGGAVQAPVYGYNSGILLPVNGTNNVVTTANNYSESFELSRVSYTGGVQGVLAVGAMVTDHIGVELTANLGLSTRSMKSVLTTVYPGENTALNTTQQANLPIMLTPSIVLESGGKINIYTRAGVTIPVKTRISQEASYVEENLNEATGAYVVTRRINWQEEFSMRLSPGFSGAVGVKLKAGKKLKVWAEAGILSMSLYYKKSELTRLDLDGQSVLGQLSPAERTTLYEFSGTYSNNNNTAATTQAAFSNFNITAGVAFDL